MSALPVYRTEVREEWIDYNGHLSEAYYVLVFGFATDEVMEQIGLGTAERARAGSSLYTVEAHVRYLQEVSRGAELVVTTAIAGSAAKKLHLAHEMRVDGELVATEEILALHVAGDPARSAPFPEPVGTRIADVAAAGPARPDWVGRAIRV
ncbi:thioesterase family protein [Brachybacterium vulturis]|uniref:thioesterase family protein n=1 Tax=Brachybacterium vulturis TaxID=2017484 RepID=UPI0037351343